MSSEDEYEGSQDNTLTLSNYQLRYVSEQQFKNQARCAVLSFCMHITALAKQSCIQKAAQAGW